MDGKAGSHRRPWRAGALALVAALVMLTAGCGFVHVNFGSPGPAATFVPNLAFVRCVRSHGVPRFPNPTSSTPVSVRLHSHGPMVRAYDTCKHLLG